MPKIIDEKVKNKRKTEEYIVKNYDILSERAKTIEYYRMQYFSR